MSSEAIIEKNWQPETFGVDWPARTRSDRETVQRILCLHINAFSHFYLFSSFYQKFSKPGQGTHCAFHKASNMVSRRARSSENRTSKVLDLTDAFSVYQRESPKFQAGAPAWPVQTPMKISPGNSSLWVSPIAPGLYTPSSTKARRKILSSRSPMLDMCRFLQAPKV